MVDSIVYIALSFVVVVVVGVVVVSLQRNEIRVNLNCVWLSTSTENGAELACNKEICVAQGPLNTARAGGERTGSGGDIASALSLRVALDVDVGMMVVVDVVVADVAALVLDGMEERGTV